MWCDGQVPLVGCLVGCWVGGESGGGLWVLVLCWNFPAWGQHIWGLVALGVLGFLGASTLG